MNDPFEKYLNCQLDDIVITGFSEFVGSKFVFHPLCRWLYLIIDTNFLLLDSNDGNILVNECSEILCNFEIENEKFTIMSYHNNGGFEFGNILNIDRFYDNSGNFIQVGLELTTCYLLINSLNISGFTVGIYKNKYLALENI